ncbi:MAG TPA: FIST N-terminal domain-containing protein [Flavisolibacter sp.]|jgi:hypothetical protein|nr:FIST N-terminal domain-containing protein [Flavisolibacter sp.]
MQAKSVKAKTLKEIENALKALPDNFKPTLAIVFLSISQDRDAVANLLNQFSISIFGATSNGEFVDEDYEQGTIAILLLDINTSDFFIQFAELNGKHDRQITSALAKQATARFDAPALIIMGSSLETDVEEVLGGFTDVMSKEANIVGGMAGDDMTFKDQYVFTNNRSGSRAVLSLVLNQEKITVIGRATHGWKAVGTEKVITRSEGNRVYTIDNTPALDLCLRYSGLAVDDPQLITELVTNFPLQLQREKGTPLMRPQFHVIWEDHSMLTSGKLPQGSKVKFSLPPDFNVIEQVVEENKKMKDEEMPDADALIVYNCGGRLMSLGPLLSEEIKGMKEVWNVPMAGMFSNAEIGRTPNGNLEMHNLTTCWVVLKEKE